MQIIKICGDELGDGDATFSDGGFRLLLRLAVPGQLVVCMQILQEPLATEENTLPLVL